MGLKCLGLYCSLNIEFAQHFYPLFYKAVAACDVTAETCIKVIFDLVIVFGRQLFSTNEAIDQNNQENSPKRLNQQQQQSFENLFQQFKHLINAGGATKKKVEVPVEIKAVIVEGFAKVLLNQTSLLIHTSDDTNDTQPLQLDPSHLENMLTELVSFYFESSANEDNKARQVLSAFLPLFCFSDPIRQNLLARVFIRCVLAMVEKADDQIPAHIQYLFWLVSLIFLNIFWIELLF